MNIHCTKKVLDQLEIKVAPSQKAVSEPLFTWHANLITVNRRKTIVLVNEANRYCVVLHGLKKKDFKSLGTLVQSAIRKTFLEEGIVEEVVERYLELAGPIEILKTKNRQTTAWVNKACESVYFFEDLLDYETLINLEVSLTVSRDLVGMGTGDYSQPNEKMYQDLESFAGEPIFKSQAAVLNIRLSLEKNQVWRRIVVPMTFSYYKLHRIIQIAFGWTESHLHEFMIYPPNGGDKPVANLVHHEESFDYDYGIPMKWDTQVRLSEYLPTRVVYTYDLGDDWEHEVVLEDLIDDYNQPFPVCLDGEGDRPPEDVGGESGYEDYLDIMANPDHPEHNSMKQWVSRQWDIEFDLEKVNHRLRHL